MTVQPTDQPHVFFVGYWVDLREPSCDCPSGCLSDRECRHIRAAKEHAKGEAVQFWRER